MDSLTGRLATLEGDLATAQTELAQEQAVFQESLTDLSGEHAAFQTSLTTAQAAVSNLQAGFQAALTTAEASLGAVQGDLTTLSSDFDALKNSFLLSRDDVTGNKKGVEALQAQQEQRGQDVKYTSVANLYTLVWLVNSLDGLDAVTTALSIAVGATGDSQLQGAWANWVSAFEQLAGGMIPVEVFNEVETRSYPSCVGGWWRWQERHSRLLR